MTKIRLDGVLYKVDAPDVDGDGIADYDNAESLQHPMMDLGTQEIVQPTELGETLKQLNDDTVDDNSRMSGIDMRSRLHYIEVASILAFDTMIALKFLPMTCSPFTRIKKRLAVSIDGKGREDIVRIVAGKKEHEEQVGNAGFFDKAKSWAGMNNGNK